jgi:hypothetical protein
MTYLENVKTWAAHRGKNELIRHLEGESISRAEAMLAKCYDCCAGYSDGGKDCEVPHCPIYGYMPYNTNKKKSGRAGRVLTDEHKAAMLAGRNKEKT